MTPISSSTEFIATAFWKASGGTRLGVIACEVGIQKARPAPDSVIATNTGQTCVPPASVNQSSRTTAAVDTEYAASSTSRRSARSAVCPAGRTSTTNGRNCARPTKPRSSGLRVS